MAATVMVYSVSDVRNSQLVYCKLRALQWYTLEDAWKKQQIPVFRVCVTINHLTDVLTALS